MVLDQAITKFQFAVQKKKKTVGFIQYLGEGYELLKPSWKLDLFSLQNSYHKMSLETDTIHATTVKDILTLRQQYQKVILMEWRGCIAASRKQCI